MIILKPDCLRRPITDKVLAEVVEGCGRILQVKIVWMSVEDCAAHYREHVGREYYPGLVMHMISGPSIFLTTNGGWEDERATAMKVREKYQGCEGPRNIIHASDSEDADDRETNYWFSD